MGLVFLALFLALFPSCSSLAATLEQVPASVIPVGFEENRGQAPAEFAHLLTHYNFGFSCTGITRRSQNLVSVATSSLTLIGASPACVSALEQPAGSAIHYCGRLGDNPAARVSSLPRYDRVTYSQPLPGIDVS